jgi:class I fructose-bisphosphate aldolase
MLLGKLTRLNRLLNQPSGKLLTVALDHGAAYSYVELPPGLESVNRVLPDIMLGQPDALVVQKGTALHCLAPFVGQVPWMLQTAVYSPHAPRVDYQIAFVEEAVALGADAIAMTITVGDDDQGQEIAMLARLVRDALPFGLPVVAHIYAKGNRVPPEETHAAHWVRYAARVGVEVGVDIVKVSYTGSPDTFAEIVALSPIPVVAAGGPRLNSLREVLTMVRGVMDADARGITIGRNLWGEPRILPMMAALRAILHHNASVDEALEVFRQRESERGATA